MPNNLNQCSFIGRLGQDPETSNLPSGMLVTKISLAVGKKRKDKNTGQVQEKTTWVPISFFAKSAEIISQYAHKGSKIYVSGEFHVDQWTDEQGNKKSFTKIVANKFELLDPPPQNNGQQHQNHGQQSQSYQHQAPAQQAPQQPPTVGGDRD